MRLAEKEAGKAEAGEGGKRFEGGKGGGAERRGHQECTAKAVERTWKVEQNEKTWLSSCFLETYCAAGFFFAAGHQRLQPALWVYGVVVGVNYERFVSEANDRAIVRCKVFECTKEFSTAAPIRIACLKFYLWSMVYR